MHSYYLGGYGMRKRNFRYITDEDIVIRQNIEPPWCEIEDSTGSLSSLSYCLLWGNSAGSYAPRVFQQIPDSRYAKAQGKPLVPMMRVTSETGHRRMTKER